MALALLLAPMILLCTLTHISSSWSFDLGPVYSALGPPRWQPRWSKMVITGARPDWKKEKGYEATCQPVAGTTKQTLPMMPPRRKQNWDRAHSFPKPPLDFMQVVSRDTRDRAAYLVVLGGRRVGLEEGGGNGGGGTGLSPLFQHAPPTHKQTLCAQCSTMMTFRVPRPKHHSCAHLHDLATAHVHRHHRGEGGGRASEREESGGAGEHDRG